MRFLFALIFTITTVFSAYSQEKEISSTYKQSVSEISQMLHQDAKYWSEGNIEAFMESYIKSDSLVFVGSRGLTYGWKETLENGLEADGIAFMKMVRRLNYRNSIFVDK